MAACDIICPVVSRETVEMERKEGRKWVPFLAEILWVRETVARNEYVRTGTRVPQKAGQSFCDNFGFGKAVTGAAEVAHATARNYMLDSLKPEWELVVKARSRDIPVLADTILDPQVVASRPPGRACYKELPPEWRVRTTRKPLVPHERTPERIVWSSHAAPAENLLAVKAFMAGEVPSPAMNAAPGLSPGPAPR